MMTKQKKLEIYMMTLKIFHKGEEEGLCRCVILALVALGLNDPRLNSTEKMKTFTPELWALKPDGYSIGEYWWHGKGAAKERELALMEIINNLNDE